MQSGSDSQSSSKTPLPPSCYSPIDSDCEQYHNCLERRFPYVGTSADYAMKYVTHFCSAYSRNYGQFSPLGKTWVDAVRKCLQVSLAPLLRECNSNIACEFIQDRAFKSHDCCYLGGAESKIGSLYLLQSTMRFYSQKQRKPFGVF